MEQKEQKYCISCLEKGNIRQWDVDCFDLEHKERYQGKSQSIKYFNDQIDKKVRELISVRDLLIDVYKMAEDEKTTQD